MIPAKKANMKIIFSGKCRMDSNKCAMFSLPSEESKEFNIGDEYLITIEGPINRKRTGYNRTVISL